MEIEKILEKYGKIVNEEIKRIMPEKEPKKELYSILSEFLARGGKRFRPTLTIISYVAVSNKRPNKEVLSAAAGIEMLHNATLLHDDIEDNSEERRGKPCVHKIYGIPIAINVGDVLYFKAYEPIAKIKNEKVRSLLAETFVKIGEGQAYDIYWAQNNVWNLKEKDYIKMVERKTGVLIGAACATGAYLGEASDKIAKTLYEYGKSIGVAFQIQDDILNLIGDEKKYGKEIGGDISEGKRTLIVVHALNNANEKERKRLMQILSSHTKNKEEIMEAIEILKRTGSIDYSINYAKKIVEKQKKKLEKIRFKNEEAKKILLDFADFFIKREF